MKFCIHTNQLNKILEIAGAATTYRASLPILQTVMITANKQSELVSATGTNLDVWCTAHRPALNIVEAGAFCVSYSKLHSISRDIKATLFFESAPKNQVKITVVDEERPQTFILLNTFDAEEFPKIGEHKMDVEHGWAIDGKRLQFVSPFAVKLASVDEARIAINQLLIDVDDNGLHLVATEGRQIGVFTLDQNKRKVGRKPIRRELLEAFTKVADVSGNVTIDILRSRTGSLTQISGGHFSITAKNYDAHFPNYRNVIPDESATVLSFDVQAPELAKMIAALMSIGEANVLEVKCNKGELTLNLKSKDDTENACAITKPSRIRTDKTKGEFKMPFNPEYLKRMFEMFPGIVTVSFGDNVRAVKVSDNQTLSCLMPMRVT